MLCLATCSFTTYHIIPSDLNPDDVMEVVEVKALGGYDAEETHRT
jgi:hypothetical protein